ncbi:MAG: SecF protein [Microgenomates group bacterium GW2011_GWB1_40_9]|nr:MAG: preprotein translocase subunit SecF, preprotein translocase subunit SecF [Microgenomates group bacterium GW2011_GWC1_39_12]KKR79285.1 MAG: SecF protein [Microgenomates group bacterium GW2011_GWB1_40_9]
MIRFTKYIWIYVMISALVLIPGVYSLVKNGVKPSVDFTGGSVLEIKTQNPIEQTSIDDAIKTQKIPVLSMQKQNGGTYLFRIGQVSEEQISKFIVALQAKSEEPMDILRNDTIGPILGSELLFKSVVAAIFAVIAILFYVAYAFKDMKSGVAAVLALIHDVLVVFGSFSLFGHFFGVEVDTLFMTAFLTTMSFSVHDTIVIFDRIREYRKRSPNAPFADVIDIALTETMSRSLINSFTIIFMLLALVLMGGETVRWFAVALLIGTITGTYSSPFVATPILLLWNRLEEKKKHH